MVSRTIYAFSLFIVLNPPLKVNVKHKIHMDFKRGQAYKIAYPLYI